MTDEEVLKQSLLNMYADNPILCEQINQICFTKLIEQYYNALYQNITKEGFDYVDSLMRSSVVVRYFEATQNATMVVVKGLEDVLHFVQEDKPTNKMEIN